MAGIKPCHPIFILMHYHLIGASQSGLEQAEQDQHFHVWGSAKSSLATMIGNHFHLVNGVKSGPPTMVSKVEGSGNEYTRTSTAPNGDKVVKKIKNPFSNDVAHILNQLNDGTFCFSDTRPTTEFIFPPDHFKISDGNGHFPIPDISHARNALARVQQFSKAPSWWDGTLDELVKVVQRMVKIKFPSIKVAK